MHHLRSIRRVALGAAVAGAAIGAVPAMASAAPTCSYSSSGGGVVTVNADPKLHDWSSSVVGKIIAVRHRRDAPRRSASAAARSG